MFECAKMHFQQEEYCEYEYEYCEVSLTLTAQRHSGSGEDVSLYTLRSWQLSPGAGGEYYYNGKQFGGGGVLVDGAGPRPSNFQGQGYGGGASGGYYEDGLPGVILMEITDSV